MKYCRKEDDAFYHTVMTNTKTKTNTNTNTNTKTKTNTNTNANTKMISLTVGWLLSIIVMFPPASWEHCTAPPALFVRSPLSS